MNLSDFEKHHKDKIFHPKIHEMLLPQQLFMTIHDLLLNPFNRCAMKMIQFHLHHATASVIKRLKFLIKHVIELIVDFQVN